MRPLIYKKVFTAVILFIFSVGISKAEEKTREIKKSFNIKRDTKIEIDNRFGDIVINRWEKNVFDIKVRIEVDGKSESRVEKALQNIDVQMNDRVSAGSLSVRTDVGSTNGNTTFKINYEISMPGNNPLTLKNSFGNIYMGSHAGDLDLVLKYGQLMAEDLGDANIRIDFSNSKCEIESIKSGELDLRYSKLAIEEVGNVRIASQFSDLELENAGDLEMEGKYGSIELESVKSLRGNVQFAGVEIEHLYDDLRLEAKHGDGIHLENVSREFGKIDIEGQFCSVDINLEDGTSTQLDFDLQFGNLKAYGDGINFNKVIKDHTSSEYQGYLGDVNATSSIRVSTRYGNIKLDVN